MKLDELHEPANNLLLGIIPESDLNRVFSCRDCDIDPSFLGFVGIYKNLSEMIPEHFTVIDFGCCYAPQCHFFTNHKKYIGVDFLTKERFSTTNTEHFEMSIAEFISTQFCKMNIDINQCFAICSYVPPWGGDNMKFVRDTFINVFTFYPSGSEKAFINNKK